LHKSKEDKAWKGQYGKALVRLRDYSSTYKNEYGENGDKQRELDHHKHLIVDNELFNTMKNPRRHI